MRVVRRKTVEGFSMVELMAAISLMALLALFGILNMRGGKAGADSQALATAVASELRLARQLALATQIPVAVVVPSGNGVQPCSQKIYIATGESVAHISRVVSYAQDNPGAVLFEGAWPLSSGVTTLSPPANCDRASSFNVTSWLPSSMLQDYCLIFTPGGGVVSHGLPLFDGSYHLVASAGCTYTSGASIIGTPPASAPPYFSATAMGRPWTITIDPSGQVSLTSGLLKQDGSVAILTGMAPPADPNPPPQVAILPASAPTVQGMAALPTPVNGSLPAGANITVVEGNVYTVMVNATDSSGRDLYVQWTADGGNFTYSQPERMTWDRQQQLWTSQWNWTPPPNAPANNNYHLNCSLGDGIVANMQPVPSSAMNIHVTPKSTIVWMHFNGVKNSVRKSNGDGSFPVQLAEYTPNWEQPYANCAVSKDGKRVVYDGQPGGGFPSDGFKVMTIDGTPLSSSPFNYPSVAEGALSPDGTRVFSPQIPSAGYVVGTCDLQGTNVTAIMPAVNRTWQSPRWSPDGKQILFLGTSVSTPPAGCMVVANVVGPANDTLITGDYQPGGFDWVPNTSPQLIYFCRGGEVWQVLADGSGGSQSQISHFGAMGYSCVHIAISPDGSQFVFVNNDGNLWISDIHCANPPVRITSGGGNSCPTWGR